MHGIALGPLWAALYCLLCARPSLASEDVDSNRPQAVALDSLYIGESWHQAKGGLATGTRHIDSFELSLAVDGGRLAGIDGLSFFADLLYSNGSAFAETLSGSAQGISAIETRDALRLYEFWIEQDFATRHTTLKLGLFDLSSAFDTIDAASLFLNPSHGMAPTLSQSGENGPSTWPVTSLGLQATVSYRNCKAKAAVLDAVPGDAARPSRTAILLSSREGALAIGELDCTLESGPRLAVGYWRYTADFEDPLTIPPTQRRASNAGTHVLAASPLLFSRTGEDGVRLFTRIGTAQSRINAIQTFVGAGAVLYTSIASSLPCEIGMAVAVAHLGQPALQALRFTSPSATPDEYNYEVTVKVAVTETFSLQADVQHIVDPGMDAAIPDGWVVGLRFEIANRWVRR